MSFSSSYNVLHEYLSRHISRFLHSNPVLNSFFCSYALNIVLNSYNRYLFYFWALLIDLPPNFYLPKLLLQTLYVNAQGFTFQLLCS
jgi:hypothetical protein